MSSSTSSQWVQLFQEPIDSGGSSSFGFSAAAAASTDGGGSSNLSPPAGSSSAPWTDMLDHPKACMSKPSRRRSRASKKTPITFLNANSTNFRALVQKFTGYHKPSSLSKRPININFAHGEPKDASMLQMQPPGDGIGNSYSCHHQKYQLQQQDHEHGEYPQQYLQQSNQGQEYSKHSFEDITNNDFDLFMSNCFPLPITEISQGFVMDDMNYNFSVAN